MASGLYYDGPASLNSIHGILMGWDLLKATAVIILAAKFATLLNLNWSQIGDLGGSSKLNTARPSLSLHTHSIYWRGSLLDPFHNDIIAIFNIV